MLNRFSLNKKLIVCFLLSGLIPALIITLVVVQQVGTSLTNEAKAKLIAVREAKGFQLEELYKTMSGQISALSQNKVTVDAAIQFTESFDNYEKESGIDHKVAGEKLKSFYSNKFAPQYVKTNIGKEFTQLEETYGQLGNNEKILQDAFISSNTNELGSKDNLTDLNNNTSYAKTHSDFHSTFRTYLNKFNYYDIFIADAKSGNIVYSVYKELDFATNIKNGAYSNTGIADVFRDALSASSADSVYISEINKYYPSYDAPAQFISAPIYKNNTITAVLIFQIPVEKVNAILTGRKGWKKQGQGDSGETYVIDHKKKMMSISRSIVEDPKGFYKMMENLNISNNLLNYMKSKETSVLAATINTVGANNVTSGETGFEIFPDYRNVNVLSSYRPLNIPGLKWYILSEMDQDEALSSLYRIQMVIYILLAITIFVILFFSVTFSRSISNSLARLAENLRLGAGNILNAADSMAKSSNSLSSATQEQASALQETSSSISEISAMVSKSSDSASTASDLSTRSKKKAEEGQGYVSSVKLKIESIHQNNETLIKNLESNNQEISEITKIIDNIAQKTNVINDIVFQTKLLSFNAAVEAARAGEHGKGFAVVAEEVGSLAAMSGSAAAEISTLLEQSVKQVNQTVVNSKQKMEQIINEGKKSVEEGLSEITICDNVIGEILNGFEEVNTSVKEIALSSQEQSSGVNEITTAVQQLDMVTQQNTNIAHESSTSADQLRVQSGDLAKIVDQIQEIVFGQVKNAAPASSPIATIKKMALKKVNHTQEYSVKEITEFSDDDFEDIA